MRPKLETTLARCGSVVLLCFEVEAGCKLSGVRYVSESVRMAGWMHPQERNPSADRPSSAKGCCGRPCGRLGETGTSGLGLPAGCGESMPPSIVCGSWPSARTTRSLTPLSRLSLRGHTKFSVSAVKGTDHRTPGGQPGESEKPRTGEKEDVSAGISIFG